MSDKKLFDFLYNHLFTISLVVIIGIAALFGDSARKLLWFKHELILEGQIWRVVTCNFVHAGWQHSLLNISGICIIGYMFERHSTPLKWWITLLAMMVISSIGYYFDPNLKGWYVGISGVLHGLFILGGIAEWHRDRLISVAVVAVIIGKLIYAQIYGPSADTEEMIGSKIYENAHLFGGILGLIIGLGFKNFLFKDFIKAKITEDKILAKKRQILTETTDKYNKIDPEFFENTPDHLIIENLFDHTLKQLGNKFEDSSTCIESFPNVTAPVKNLWYLQLFFNELRSSESIFDYLVNFAWSANQISATLRALKDTESVELYNKLRDGIYFSKSEDGQFWEDADTCGLEKIDKAICYKDFTDIDKDMPDFVRNRMEEPLRNYILTNRDYF